MLADVVHGLIMIALIIVILSAMARHDDAGDDTEERVEQEDPKSNEGPP